MALKPPDNANIPLPSLVDSLARKPLAATVQYVDASATNDSGDGKSWGTAKKTIEAAVADLPNGGPVFVMPGTYTEPKITLDGHQIEGCIGAGGTSTVVTVIHSENDDLFYFYRGGRLRNVYCYQLTNGLTGAAIKGVSTGSPRAGTIHIENVTVSGDHPWEHDLYLDGHLDNTVGGPGDVPAVPNGGD